MAAESQWTLETLKEFLLSRIDAAAQLQAEVSRAQQEALKVGLSEADKAIQKNDIATEKRFEGVNEFRKTLGDQQQTYITRNEVVALFKAMEDKIAVLTNSNADKIAALSQYQDRMQTERIGIKGGWGYAVAVIGLVATVLSAASFLMR